MKKLGVFLIGLVFLLNNSLSQEKKPFSLNGYITSMQSVIFDSLRGSFSNDNLIHNRLNFRLYPTKHLTLAMEMRNRIFWGDMIRSNSSYAESIGSDAGWIDMSWNIISEKSFLINSTIDRFWLDLNYDKIQVRIGRQRINWGQTLVWNPNDLFNAYSFFDFDYVERPGSDAIRFQYFPGFTSTLDIAFKTDNNNNVTAAALYRFNKWGYDIQFIGGYFNSSDIVAGAGWSGSIGSFSFRGEGTWFQPSGKADDTTATGLFTIGFDRIFKNSSMAQIQLMYCNNPLKLTDFDSFYSGNLSSRDLAFSRFTAFGQVTLTINPLLKISLSAMWFPDLKGYFAGPSLDYSLAENTDFSLIWQHFNSNMGDEKLRINLGFLRLKYSF
jgi:hypothetical protein